MKVSTMRLADRALGIPACAVLTLFRKLLDRRRSDSPVRRILFVKLAEQGATVLAYPALRSAVDRVGAQNVFFMVFEENRFILDMLEVVPKENVICLRTDGIFSLLSSVVQGLQQARGLNIDTVIDMEFFARSTAVLSYLSGAARRVGFHGFAAEGPWRGDLMSHRLGYNPHLHTMQMYGVMVASIDADASRLPALDLAPPASDAPLPVIQPAADETERVRAIVRKASGLAEPWPLILLNANAGDMLPLRKWESARYIELAKRLLATSSDVRIAFTGSPAEASSAAEFVAAVGDKRCFSVAGLTTLRELIVLYTLAEVMVTNDSGPAHFAALTPIDVVTLFGPETPDLFAARTPRSHILWANLPCSPCVSAFNNRVSTCTDNVCMKRITVDQVFELVSSLLERRLRGDRQLPVLTSPGGQP
jgi:ADP-heptose:LPS heptosyltransferase